MLCAHLLAQTALGPHHDLLTSNVPALMMLDELFKFVPSAGEPQDVLPDFSMPVAPSRRHNMYFHTLLFQDDLVCLQ